MKEIQLTKGRIALVDDCDYEWLKQYDRLPNGKRKSEQMHRMIMHATQGVEVDHVSRDRLDNRRSNLRLCSHTQNAHNRSKQSNTHSQYRGVTWHKRDKKWIAQIVHNKKLMFLGNFTKEKDAAKAYDKSAKELFKEYANPNFPD